MGRFTTALLQTYCWVFWRKKIKSAQHLANLWEKVDRLNRPAERWRTRL